MHNIQEGERSHAFTRINTCPENTHGKINGPPFEVKCKIDTGEGANIMPIYVFRKLSPGPILLGLKTLRHMGIFVKHPMVYIETINTISLIQH